MLQRFLCVVVLSAVFSGCASWFLGGGELVSAGYQPTRVACHLSYESGQKLPYGQQYSLIDTGSGLAVWEMGEDGSGTLYSTHWTDDDGEHYAAWVKGNFARDFVFPAAESAPVECRFYAAGTYTIQTVDGLSRPVPSFETAAVLTQMTRR